MSRLRMLLAMSMLLVAGCSGAQQRAPAVRPPAAPIHDQLIVPGQRIGPASLGLSPADVFRLFGNPQSSYVQTKKEPGLHHSYKYRDLTVWIDSASNRVTYLITSSPNFATAEGIRAGMSELEVRAKLGEPEPARRFNDQNLTYFYRSRGLEIIFNPSKGNQIDSIWVTARR